MEAWRKWSRRPLAVVLGASVLAIGLLAWRSGGPAVSAEGGDSAAADRVQLSPPPTRDRTWVAPAQRGPGVEAPTGAGTSAPVRTTGRDDKLQGRLATAIANAVKRARKLSNGKVTASNVTVAVHVRETERKLELASIRAGYPMRPASNVKLMTCATALVLLGSDWSFETRIELRGDVRGGTLQGDLIARAGGDPVYEMGADGSVAAWVEPLARALEAAGIKRVQGALILDEGTFLDPGPGPEWPNAKEHWKDYAALSGGFSANAGCITATVDAGRVGGAAAVKVRPRAHGLVRKGKVTTKAAGSSLNVAVEARRHGLTVRGSVPAGTDNWATHFAHPDPVELFGHSVVGELGRRGVQVQDSFRRERDARGGRPLVTLKSPLAQAIVPVLLDSNNSVADQIFFATGNAVLARGDRDGGSAAAEKALEALGVSAAGFIQVDGSGLSRANRVSARQMTALLEAVLALGGDAARVYRDALPVAGESGTLEGRMRKSPARGRVRAKTGFIGGTSALSGLAQTEDDRTLVFSILVSYPRFGGLNTSVWKPMQDEICAILVASRKSGS